MLVFGVGPFPLHSGRMPHGIPRYCLVIRRCRDIRRYVCSTGILIQWSLPSLFPSKLWSHSLDIVSEWPSDPRVAPDDVLRSCMWNHLGLPLVLGWSANFHVSKTRDIVLTDPTGLWRLEVAEGRILRWIAYFPPRTS